MSANEAIQIESAISVDAQIGRRAHQLMWDRKITQVQFGQTIGMDQSAVAKRFRGKLGWSATQVKTAAGALHTSVAYLYGESNDPAPLNPVGPTGLEPMTSTVEYARLAEIIPLFGRAA